MRKLIKTFLLIIFVFFLIGCGNEIPEIKEKYVVTVEYNNGDACDEFIYEDGSKIIIEEDFENTGYIFDGWYLDQELTKPMPVDYIVKSDIVIYAKWKVETKTVTFIVEGEIFSCQEIENRGYATDPGVPTKEGYTFSFWSSTINGDIVFNFDKKITRDVEVYAQWEPTSFTITYVLGYDVYSTKYDLYKDFFTDFYNYLIEYTDANLEKYAIENAEDFLVFCYNWNANGRDSFYGVGDAFGKYFVTKNTGGTLEQQTLNSFIGYCYHNNMYQEFIPFLMQFFAYWRTDEGYTGGVSDPNNTGNDFFDSPWAALVDTCKFFYFTSKNLNDTYPWFTSQRVKDALDNVPGVSNNLLETHGDIENPIYLLEPNRTGYKFLGWYDEEGNKVTEVYKQMTVYAKWEKE